MRKFLLILVCAFSFCVNADTNTVQLTQEQITSLLNAIQDYYNRRWLEWDISIGSNGNIYEDENYFDAGEEFYPITQGIAALIEFFHVIMSGNLDHSYNTQDNNILAYASSLRSHNADVRELLEVIEDNTHGVWLEFIPLFSRFDNITNSLNGFRSDYINNFERLYNAITNIDFNVSISNQIDLLQVMSDGISTNFVSITNGLQEILPQIQDVRDHINLNHGELMDFLHSLSNSVLFTSNLCNCCGSVNSNYHDSVLSMLNWMTNNFPDVADSPIFGGAGSNSVWSVWHPSEPLASGWDNLMVPSVLWLPNQDDDNHHPEYSDSQYDSGYHALWLRYKRLLDGYRSNGLSGQEFFAGLVDLQLHIIANMSTQLYMIDQKMPSKTNLWDWIEQYKSKVSEEVTKAEQENSEIVSSVSYLLDYTPFGVVGGHFPKVSSALNSLKLEQGASPVLRIPIPRSLRVSDSDELIVDVRESDWFSTGRTWCRWVFTFIWGWLFIRLGLVPIFYVFFFTVRIAEISAHLVFMGSVRGSSGIVSSFGASAVDMVLSLLGIDTDFKRFVWGIMRD